MVTIKAGTILFHGTDCDDFCETEDGLTGPAWLSSSREVAEYFARRQGGWGGRKRIISYQLAEDISLHEILSAYDMSVLAEKYQIDLCGVEAIRESVEASGITGWVIPNNYPNGDDIMIAAPSLLDFVNTEFL